jgi:type IV pilus assembly protein PilA
MRHRRTFRGFTLVELMIVIAVVGVLSALGVAGASRYVATAKTVEARNTVGAIARAAASQYDLERFVGETLGAATLGTSTTHVLCQSAEAVPDTVDKVRGKKYQPTKMPGVDFGVGSNLLGWHCLGFSISEAIHYQYDYNRGPPYVSVVAGAPDPGSNGFEAVAIGDLDGDGVESVFARNGIVANNQVRLTTRVFAANELD